LWEQQRLTGWRLSTIFIRTNLCSNKGVEMTGCTLFQTPDAGIKFSCWSKIQSSLLNSFQ
jgi:hypothetical protein